MAISWRRWYHDIALASPASKEHITTGAFLMTRYLVLIGLVLSASPFSAQAQRLKVGSTAPDLEIAEWMRGTPVDLAAGRGQKVYVVEFWATWCGPCMKSIEHLNHLQKAYEKDGVVFLGVSQEETGVVRNFLESNRFGKSIEYNIACDKKSGTFKNYMVAAQQRGIPTAFIVDKQGMIAWIGSTLHDGSRSGPDFVRAVFRIAVTVRSAPDMRYLRKYLPALQKAIDSGEWAKAIELSEQIAYGPQPGLLGRTALPGPVQPGPGHHGRRQRAWFIGDTAMYIAKEACTICDSQDANALDCYAYTLQVNGRIQSAIEQIKKAIELTPDGDMKDTPQDRAGIVRESRQGRIARLSRP